MTIRIFTLEKNADDPKYNVKSNIQDRDQIRRLKNRH